MLREQVQAIRASAAAQVAMADAILRALNGDHRQPSDGAECLHPPEKRLAAPRMGVPDAWLCECGVEGN